MAAVIQGAYTTLDELLSLRHGVSVSAADGQAMSNHSLAGNTRSRRRGPGIEFEEVRAYVPGDDIRNISWRLSARTGRPMTKLYTEEREKPVYIVLDQRSPMFFGSQTVFKSVTAARIAGLGSWMAYRQAQRLGGMVIGEQLQQIKIMHSRHSVPKLLSLVATLNTALNIDSSVRLSLSEVILECKKRLPAGTRVVLISDFHDFTDACAAALIALSKQRDLQMIKVSDSLEETMGVGGSVGISDGKTQRRLVITDQLRAEYLRQRTRQRDKLKACAVRCSTGLVSVTEQDVLHPGLLELQSHGT